MNKLKGKNILVAGGAGFIGSNLVDRLVLEKPKNIIVVDNLFLGKESNLKDAKKIFNKLKFYRQDASNFRALKDIIKAENIDIVFNLAVVPLPTSLIYPRLAVDKNIAIVSVFCELLRKKLYKTLIHFSSSEVYGSAQYAPMDEKHPLFPHTPYAASKIAGDHIVLSYSLTFGVDVAIVRPFNNFGPRQNDSAYAGIIPIVIRKALNKEPVTIYGDGKQTRDFVFVRDTADAAIRIFKNPETRGCVINIASGRELSVNDLVGKILKLCKINLPVIHGPRRAGDVRRHCGGIGLAKRLIGFKPHIMSYSHLRETIQWYIERL